MRTPRLIRAYLALWNCGDRVAVTFNGLVVNQPALIGHPTARNGETCDVTDWLTPGRNGLAITLFGPMTAEPFRLRLWGDVNPWEFDERMLVPLPAPWRCVCWSLSVEGPLIRRHDHAPAGEGARLWQ